MTDNAKKIVKDLFLYFMNDPSLMPESYRIKSAQNLARAVADYLAGMTDRYAIKTHKEIKLG
jgi:dGTPase